MRNPDTTIGIDVSKASLDVCLLPNGECKQFPNDPAGIAELLKLAKATEPSLLVLEPSGGYEKALQRALLAQGLPCAKVNARKIRHFARCIGRTAKTDMIDAEVLARYAATIKPEKINDILPDADLADLIKRRRQLVDEAVREKNRLEKKPSDNTRRSIRRHIAFLEKEIACFDKEIAAYIAASETLARKAEVLRSFRGVGQQTVAILLADMPELGQVGTGPIASLVGVAPHNNDSGAMKGKRMISGGRSAVRKALYMATLAAIRQDGFVRDFYLHLKQKGKPGKVALTAAMRKLLIRINATIRDEFYA